MLKNKNPLTEMNCKVITIEKLHTQTKQNKDEHMKKKAI